MQYNSPAQCICNTIAPNLLHHSFSAGPPFWATQAKGPLQARTGRQGIYLALVRDKPGRQKRPHSIASLGGGLPSHSCA
eukprot:3623810-Pyramimonas_sp.AAC.1